MKKTIHLLSCVSAVACLSLPSRGFPAPIFIKESNLRALADIEGEYSEFSYMVDFLKTLRDCGIEGDIVSLGAPVTGLHLLVRSVNLRARCYSGHWELLDDLRARERMAQIVSAGQILLITLESTPHFHSALLDPSANSFATALTKRVCYERACDEILFLGRQAIFESVEPLDSARNLTDELLDLASMDLEVSTKLKLLEILARSHNAEWRTKPDLTLIEAELSGRRIHVASPEQFVELKSVLAHAKISVGLTNELLFLLRPHLTAQNYFELEKELLSRCERILRAQIQRKLN